MHTGVLPTIPGCLALSIQPGVRSAEQLWSLEKIRCSTERTKGHEKAWTFNCPQLFSLRSFHHFSLFFLSSFSFTLCNSPCFYPLSFSRTLTAVWSPCASLIILPPLPPVSLLTASFSPSLFLSLMLAQPSYSCCFLPYLFPL